MKYYTAIIVLLYVFMISCSDNGFPELTFDTDLNNLSFAPGDTMVISGVATDDEGFSTVTLQCFELNLNMRQGLFANPGVLSFPFIFEAAIDSMTEAGDYEVTISGLDLDVNSVDHLFTITVD